MPQGLGVKRRKIALRAYLRSPLDSTPFRQISGFVIRFTRPRSWTPTGLTCHGKLRPALSSSTAPAFPFSGTSEEFLKAFNPLLLATACRCSSALLGYEKGDRQMFRQQRLTSARDLWQ